ncbi:MAG: AF1514 family protein [Proteobacteria bacterium]|nr:AF1514 family protein [Pseudomonadota bacterium]MBU1640528.1 AF1514 family protein [Pseudomonadota bacterium]
MAEIIPITGPVMANIAISVVGIDVDWDVARDLAYTIANRYDEEPMLMSWFDKATGKFSPSCCKCEMNDGPAWEIYGKNHGGRYRISVNDDAYVFIYS